MTLECSHRAVASRASLASLRDGAADPACSAKRLRGPRRGGDRSDRRCFRGALSGVRLLDVHSDADHHRSVFTLAGHAGRAGGRAVARRRRGRQADRCDGRGAQRPRARSRAGGPASARRRGRCRAARLPRPAGARRRVRRGARRGGSDRRRSWGCRCSSTASSPAPTRSSTRTRAQLRRGGRRRTGSANGRGGREASRPDFGPAAHAPERRGDARRGAPAAGGLQPPARRRLRACGTRARSPR